MSARIDNYKLELFLIGFYIVLALILWIVFS